MGSLWAAGLSGAMDQRLVSCLGPSGFALRLALASPTIQNRRLQKPILLESRSRRFHPKDGRVVSDRQMDRTKTSKFPRLKVAAPKEISVQDGSSYKKIVPSTVFFLSGFSLNLLFLRTC